VSVKIFLSLSKFILRCIAPAKWKETDLLIPGSLDTSSRTFLAASLFYTRSRPDHSICPRHRNRLLIIFLMREPQKDLS
jgi:hypothetical protein